MDAPMPKDVIKNPILNSPFIEPTRHFRFKDDGITSTVIDSRRPRGYLVPIAKPKAKSKQATFDFDPDRNVLADNPFINQVREKVRIWREGGYAGVTRTTQRLLDYWADSERERKLFFCQREAAETAIYITEVAGKFNDHWIENQLREENQTFNLGLFRLAFKMATGSGKTVVMAMLMAWQNVRPRLMSPSPGMTIRNCSTISLTKTKARSA
jgi:type III restriction enzyme